MNKAVSYTVAWIGTAVMTVISILPSLSFIAKTDNAVHTNGGYSSLLYITYIPIIFIAVIGCIVTYRLYTRTREAMLVLPVVWVLQVVAFLWVGNSYQKVLFSGTSFLAYLPVVAFVGVIGLFLGGIERTPKL